MKENKDFEVIIIGGSYSGLSAGMSLGRALRKVLIIDSDMPCNRQTPHSHNFITQDGKTPTEIARVARVQVQAYDTVNFYEGQAVSAQKTDEGFEIRTHSGESFTAKKLIFATGLKDIIPDISGFAECWGVSILHCPYCHGYEVRHKKTGILANGDMGFHFVQLISNWTKNLMLFTNGKPTLNAEQTQIIRKNNIEIIDKALISIEHQDKQIQGVTFHDGSQIPLETMYARPAFIQSSDIPEKLGCQLNELGLLKVDNLQKTSVEGVYACGDNSSMRAVSVAVSTGTTAGAAVNNKLCEEEFLNNN
ncbi:thioredoxin reductase [Catalinimonas alkaloidigena]|uniref:NAD(P)/FAD-dependent oxidoreductase n=1 Tax=Catalinimonas alkaloidigena TaxID=1075417 RepID=UPI0024073011|nr:NAD(P)/FAD-dependent oxidoreductase [Catalinimonas alkaloidigena]MDF9800867.1 thioredoxin reductase [Catalinimonas alkaloidigena]